MEIKASEFRIGNYYNQFGNYHKVSWVTLKNLSEAPITQLWCKPIELSEEILLKCGFTVDGVLIDYTLDLRESTHLKILGYDFKNKRAHVYHLINSDWIGCNVCEIIYIHQLQNLFFALTQTELEVTL